MTLVRNPLTRNLEQIRARIARAAERSGRSAGAVRLVAVSKKQPVASILATMAAGQRCFGESQLQEARDKIPQIQNPEGEPEWHLIGHLQTNKVKYVPALFQWVHSLDSVALANRLDHAALAAGRTLNVLIQVNVPAEASKYGISPEALPALLDNLLAARLRGLRLRGLMTIGPQPQTQDPEDEIRIRKCFARLRRLGAQARERHGLAEFTELSMGMSDDFEAAIEEGSTMVRLGAALFGVRR